MALGCFLVDTLEGQIDHLEFGGVAVVAGLAGAVARRNSQYQGSPSSSQVLTAFVVALATLTLVSAVVYEFGPATSGFGESLFESVAGYTTTASTTMSGDEFAETGRSVLLWRALTQWVGGAFAVIFIAAVLPFWGTGEEESDLGEDASFRGLAPTGEQGVARVLQVYTGLSAMFAGAFLVAGLPWFDAVTHAASTVSTGGFATTDLSVLVWESALVEWITTVCMALMGLSIAGLWWVLRGRPDQLLRSPEARAYGGALFLGGTWMSLSGADTAPDTATAIRHGFFTASSMLSTTGHRVVDWTEWNDGAQLLALILIGVGAMSGAVGAGFRWRRALQAAKLGAQSLRSQLRPNAVSQVKIGTRLVTEPLVNRMTAQQTLACVLGIVTVFLLALSGLSLRGSIGTAVSTLSTFGPGLGEYSAFSSAGEVISSGGRWSLLPVMVAGRLSLYPLFVAGAGLWDVVRRRFT